MLDRQIPGTTNTGSRKGAGVQQDGPSVATRPVFVDATGRRGRWIRRVCWVLGVVVAAYIAVVFLALVGPPSLSRLAVPGLGPVLPGSGAPGLRTATGGHAKPSAVLSPRPKASDHPSPVPSTARSGAPARPTSGPAAVPAPTSAAPRPPSPTAASTPPPTARSASPRPRASQTPPGQASGHPSPHSSHARGGTAAPSPSP